MQHSFYYIATLLLLMLTACSIPPDACIEAESKNYAVKKVGLKSCAVDVPYQLWIFEDGNGIEGEDGSRWFNNGGYINIKLECYNKSGRSKSVDKKSIEVGFKYLDSLVVDSLSYNLLYIPGETSKANLRLIVGGIPSINSFKNVNSNDFPLTFYFDENDRIEDRIISYRVTHFDSINNYHSNIIVYNELNPHEDFESPWVFNHTTDSYKYMKSKMYWRFDY